jgi:hypothetical protein
MWSNSYARHCHVLVISAGSTHSHHFFGSTILCVFPKPQCPAMDEWTAQLYADAYMRLHDLYDDEKLADVIERAQVSPTRSNFQN